MEMTRVSEFSGRVSNSPITLRRQNGPFPSSPNPWANIAQQQNAPHIIVAASVSAKRPVAPPKPPATRPVKNDGQQSSLRVFPFPPIGTLNPRLAAAMAPTRPSTSQAAPRSGIVKNVEKAEKRAGHGRSAADALLDVPTTAVGVCVCRYRCYSPHRCCHCGPPPKTRPAS